MRGDVPVTVPPGPAREAAERELSEPIYHQNDPSLLQRVLNRLWDAVTELLSTASAAAPGGWVGLVAITVVVVLLVVALRLRLGRLRRAATPDSALFGDAPRTAAVHRAAAERYAAQGRWAEAVQERMRALVRSLEERAVLDPRPGRTADEAAAEADRILPGHGPALRDAARTFDDVTYGAHPATEHDYTALVDLDTVLLRTKPRFTAIPADVPAEGPAHGTATSAGNSSV